MDEFNNNNNNENQNFGEESFAEQERRSEQYGQAPQQGQYDPYNMPYEQRTGGQSSPYGYNNGGQPNPNSARYNQGAGQPNPYNTSYAAQRQVPPDFDPYKQPLPQNSYYGGGMYLDENGVPYKTGLATASLVIGIISLLLTLTFMIYIPPLGILPILGIVFGCVHKSKHQPVGKGTSTAGIICSSLSLGFALIFIIFCVYIAMNYMPQMLEYIKTIDPEVYQQYYDMFHEVYPEWFDTAAALFSKLF